MSQPARLKVADFGSAVDDHTLSNLYPKGSGPSVDDLTLEYSPPEVVLGELPFDPEPEKTDAWQVGMVLLELVIGAPPSSIFIVESREEIRLRHRLRNEPQAQRRIARAMKEIAYGTLCISPSSITDPYATPRPSKDDGTTPCTFVEFQRRLHELDTYSFDERDPALSHDRDEIGDGTPLGQMGERLLWRLLQWRSDARVTVREALQKHAYFRASGPRGFVCPVCGREFDMLGEHGHDHLG